MDLNRIGFNRIADDQGWYREGAKLQPGNSAIEDKVSINQGADYSNEVIPPRIPGVGKPQVKKAEDEEQPSLLRHAGTAVLLAFSIMGIINTVPLCADTEMLISNVANERVLEDSIGGPNSAHSTSSPEKPDGEAEKVAGPVISAMTEEEKDDPNLGADPSFLQKLRQKAWEVFTSKKGYGNIKVSCARRTRGILAKMIGKDRGPGAWRDVKYNEADRSVKGKPVSYLKEMIDEGELKPGSMIYLNVKPGADPSSTKLKYKPHWITYLGVNEKGVPEFVDQSGYGEQAGRDRTLEGVIRKYGGRKLDTVFFPREYDKYFVEPA